MIRDFIKEGSIYSVAGFLAKGVSLFLIPIFTMYFTPTDYGVLDLLYVLSMFFSALFSFQIGQGLTRYVGEADGNKMCQQRLASTALWFIFASLLVGSVIALLFRDPIMELLGLTHPSYRKSYVLAIVSIALNGLFFFMSSHLQALRKKTIFAASSFMHALLGITGTYFFVIVLDKSINGVYYATIAIVPMVLLFQFYHLRSEYRFIFNQEKLKQLLRYSMPLVPAAIAYVVLSLTDRIFITYFLDKGQLGIYSVGFKFSVAISIIISGFTMALGPLIYQRFKVKDVSRELSVLFNWFVVIGLFLVVVMSIFAEETIILFTQKPFYDASDVLPMLYLSVWFSGLAMFSPGMNLMNKTKWIGIVVLVSAGLNVLLNSYFVPNYGIKGAALSTLISSMVNYGILFVLSQKLYKYSVQPILVVICLLISAINVLYTTSSRVQVELENLGLLIKVIIVLGLGLSIVFIIRNKRTWFWLSGDRSQQLKRND